MERVTTEQIEQFMAEAELAGDERQVKVCRRALDGSARARKAVEKTILGIRHEAAYRAMRDTVSK